MSREFNGQCCTTAAAGAVYPVAHEEALQMNFLSVAGIA
jgi:hypothetical protein